MVTLSNRSCSVFESPSATNEQDIGVREITKAIHQLQNTSGQLNVLSDETLKSALSSLENTEAQSKELFGFGSGMKIDIKLPEQTFDLNLAISAHLDWKMKLSRYLSNPD